MSNQVTSATSGKVFTKVNSQNQENSKGALIIVRPSALAEANFTGPVAEGIYEEAVPNKFDKMDYKIRTESGDLIIINSTGSLAKQMASVQLGSLVLIEYNGKRTLTKGKLAGKSVHNFTVSVA